MTPSQKEAKHIFHLGKLNTERPIVSRTKHHWPRINTLITWLIMLMRTHRVEVVIRFTCDWGRMTLVLSLQVLHYPITKCLKWVTYFIAKKLLFIKSIQVKLIIVVFLWTVRPWLIVKFWFSKYLINMKIKCI